MKTFVKNGIYAGIVVGSFFLGKSCDDKEQYKIAGLEFQVKDSTVQLSVEETKQDYQLIMSNKQPYWIQKDTTLTLEQQEKVKSNLERITQQTSLYKK